MTVTLHAKCQRNFHDKCQLFIHNKCHVIIAGGVRNLAACRLWMYEHQKFRQRRELSGLL
jgi:hypothetical protein